MDDSAALEIIVSQLQKIWYPTGVENTCNMLNLRDQRRALDRFPLNDQIIALSRGATGKFIRRDYDNAAVPKPPKVEDFLADAHGSREIVVQLLELTDEDRDPKDLVDAAVLATLSVSSARIAFDMQPTPAHLRLYIESNLLVAASYAGLGSLKEPYIGWENGAHHLLTASMQIDDLAVMDWDAGSEETQALLLKWGAYDRKHANGV